MQHKGGKRKNMICALEMLTLSMRCLFSLTTALLSLMSKYILYSTNMEFYWAMIFIYSLYGQYVLPKMYKHLEKNATLAPPMYRAIVDLQPVRGSNEWLEVPNHSLTHSNSEGKITHEYDVGWQLCWPFGFRGCPPLFRSLALIMFLFFIMPTRRVRRSSSWFKFQPHWLTVLHKKTGSPHHNQYKNKIVKKKKRNWKKSAHCPQL